MYEVFEKLLAQKKVKVAEVVAATGIAQSTFSDWKSGRSKPKQPKMQKIADYFGVTVDYLMTGETQDGYYINPETAKKAQELFENKELSVLFDAARDASPEDLQTVYDMLMALKRKEQS